jgi:hypothetical protein
MLAWALQTVELAAKAGMAATKRGVLSAWLQGPPAVPWALQGLPRRHLSVGKARAMPLSSLNVSHNIAGSVLVKPRRLNGL